MPRKSNAKKPNCFVRADCNKSEREEIQGLVCVGEAKYKDDEENQLYCIMHYRRSSKKVDFDE